MTIRTPNTAKTHATSIPPTMKGGLSDDAEWNVIALAASTVVEHNIKLVLKYIQTFEFVIKINPNRSYFV